MVSGGAARYVLKCHFVSLVEMALVLWKPRKILSDIEDKCNNNLFQLNTRLLTITCYFRTPKVDNANFALTKSGQI